jgi:hypothetical protein
MPNDLPTSSQAPGPHDTDREDDLLMHELTVVNAMLGRYVLRYLDEGARRAGPIATADERSLADRLTAAADRIRARAERRSQQDGP